MNTEMIRSENERSQPGVTPVAKEVRFRCPHCQKLYCTTNDVFEDEKEPGFDCASCDKAFYLTTETGEFGLFKTKTPEKIALSTCPKCSNLKPQKSDECPTCGVLESKYIQLQKDESPVLYEMNALWQKVVANFDEDQYHQDFLNRCHQQMALNFAWQKYAELQKSLGHDSLCAKYIKQIETRLDQQLKSPKYNDVAKDPETAVAALSGFQILFLTIGTIGMLMLIYNKYVPTFPNFNGMVLSLTILAFGVGLFSNSRKPLSL
ncbi:MAG: hypothetical protein K0R29_603 [Pseudobdellovibrio sp.]|jgi:hypothetical protein|nr:hypothetical protein [Pseudobdellovibrio sp.]